MATPDDPVMLVGLDILELHMHIRTYVYNDEGICSFLKYLTTVLCLLVHKLTFLLHDTTLTN